MGAWLGDIVPELILAAGIIVLLPLGAFLPKNRRAVSTWVALVILALAAATTLPLFTTPPHAVFDSTYAVDPFAAYFKLVAITATALVLIAAGDTFRGLAQEANVPTLLVLACLGIVALAASEDLVLIALFLSLVTVTSYVLVGTDPADHRSTEGALKLFLFGAVATVVMFYGMTLLYGLTGSLSLLAIAQRLPTAPRVTTAVALAFVIAGYGFELTIVPFHFWAPDTYQGAPTPVTAFLSVGPKAAGLAVLLRTLVVAAPNALAEWPRGVAVLAAITMVAGALLALRQTSLKRLLAYSSVSQAGYLLIGVAASGNPIAVPAMLFYLAVYIAMNLAAFLAVAAVERRIGTDDLAACAGLSGRMPLTALLLTLSLLGLAGIPPLGSFVGTTLLFAAAIGAGMTWLAIVAAGTTAISLFYYVRVIQVVYLSRTSAARPAAASRPAGRSTVFAVAFGTLATLVIGVWPNPLATLTRHAASLFMH